MKSAVKLIAPELTALIDGSPQLTRVPIEELGDKTLIIDDKEYFYEMQQGYGIEDLIAGLVELIQAEDIPQVEVVNVQDEYFDIRGMDDIAFTAETADDPQPYNISEAVSADLWDLFWEDVQEIVNEDTFTGHIDRARRYLMAHLLTMHDSVKGSHAAATSEKVGDVAVTYADPLSKEGMSLTKYGRVYRGIYLSNRRIRFT